MLIHKNNKECEEAGVNTSYSWAYYAYKCGPEILNGGSFSIASGDHIMINVKRQSVDYYKNGSIVHTQNNSGYARVGGVVHFQRKLVIGSSSNDANSEFTLKKIKWHGNSKSSADALTIFQGSVYGWSTVEPYLMQNSLDFRNPHIEMFLQDGQYEMTNNGIKVTGQNTITTKPFRFDVTDSSGFGVIEIYFSHIYNNQRDNGGNMDSWGGAYSSTNNFIRIYDTANSGANDIRFYQFRNFSCGVNGLNSQYPKVNASLSPQGNLGTACFTMSHNFMWPYFAGEQGVNFSTSGRTYNTNQNSGGDIRYMDNILVNNSETHICISIENETTKVYKNGNLYHEIYCGGYEIRDNLGNLVYGTANGISGDAIRYMVIGGMDADDDAGTVYTSNLTLKKFHFHKGLHTEDEIAALYTNRNSTGNETSENFWD